MSDWSYFPKAASEMTRASAPVPTSVRDELQRSSMERIVTTKLWQRTLVQYDQDSSCSVEKAFGRRLRIAFEAFRKNVATLSNEIPRYVPALKVHEKRRYHADCTLGILARLGNCLHF
jgi:hypothetical protein